MKKRTVVTRDKAFCYFASRPKNNADYDPLQLLTIEPGTGKKHDAVIVMGASVHVNSSVVIRLTPGMMTPVAAPRKGPRRNSPRMSQQAGPEAQTVAYRKQNFLLPEASTLL